MVLSFIAGFAAVFGTAEGVRAAQTKSRREEHRTRKNNLVVHCPKGSKYSSLLEGRRIVLAGDKAISIKLYIDTGTEYSVPFGHPFEGYFLAYPEARFSGLVSTITHEAPIMNWVYVHKETYEVKFGIRAQSEGNLTGPWDCTRQDKRLTFNGWEGFCAVKEGDFWGLYFDRDGDRLKGKVGQGTPLIDLELLRTELKINKPETVEVRLTEEQARAAREQEEAQARAQAEETARLRAQEEMLREALRRAQEQARDEERKKAETGGLKNPRSLDRQPKSPRVGQPPQSPRRQKQPKSPRPRQHGERKVTHNVNARNGQQKATPSLSLPSPGPNGGRGASSSRSSTVNSPRTPKGNGPKMTPRKSGRNGTNGQQGPKGANGQGRTNRKSRMNGPPRSGGGSSLSSGRQTPSSMYPSKEELPPSPEVD